MGKIPQVGWGQVTRLLLQEVKDNSLWCLCRAAVQRPGRRGERPEKEEAPMRRQIYSLQIFFFLIYFCTAAIAQCLFTSHIGHSSCSEDNTGTSFCPSGCQEVGTSGSSLPVSPRSCEGDESECFSASATLRGRGSRRVLWRLSGIELWVRCGGFTYLCGPCGWPPRGAGSRS